MTSLQTARDRCSGTTPSARTTQASRSTRPSASPTSRSIRALFILIVAALAFAAHAPAARAVGTAFTYQGKLDQNSFPATSACDFQFTLWDAATDGTIIAGPVISPGVSVETGLFTTSLDFGAVFDGSPRWLEISVQCAGDADYTVLSPRQEITSSPYSVHSGYAESSPGGGGSSQWTTNGTSIYYNDGYVGLGLTNPGAMLHVVAGTANVNPGVFSNNNVSYAALACGNYAANGLGLYDGTSARNYLSGKLGVGTLDPDAKVHAVGGSRGVKGEATGGGLLGPAVGVWGIGYGSQFFGPAAGVIGESNYGNGVEGTTSNADSFGGYFSNTGVNGIALKADGKAQVKALQILGGADIVEGFDTAEGASEAGTVLVIDEANAGKLRASRDPYDRKVAGVVSGAGGVAPGLHLAQEGVMDGSTLVAMTGRVYVKCSAQNGAIRPGDLLTTSGISGHAMRATDAGRRGGAVIGKAMSALESGTGLVLVLVNLQ